MCQDFTGAGFDVVVFVVGDRGPGEDLFESFMDFCFLIKLIQVTKGKEERMARKKGGERQGRVEGMGNTEMRGAVIPLRSASFFK